jgi:dTDP-4-dehydrorhamnose reductase
MVFGAGAQVGLHLIETASGSGPTTHSDANICDSDAVAAAIAKHAPSVVVNAAENVAHEARHQY